LSSVANISMIGQTISHYKILEKLGEGGMGVVYKAHDTKLDRVVALKFLPDRVNQHETEKARFLQEAQLAATINHPNVCTIYRIEEYQAPSSAGGPPVTQQFIEMEYVDGPTLKKLVPVGDVQTCLRYALQIADALREAHKKGIVHRDIKCENIMVSSEGKIKVMDFGLAKLKGSARLTRTASTVGTVAYMSPEQIQGGEVDYRSDQFSLGVVIFEMLTGKHPFRGEHEAAMMYSIVNEEPLAIDRVRRDVPEALSRIVTKLLAKDPAGRYERTEELVTELRAADESRDRSGVSIPGSQKPRVGTGGSGRRPVVIIGAALLMIAAIIIWMKTSSESDVQIDSIAVLPLRNASGDPNADYLSDGLTEHIINSLSRLKKLRVIPRSTAFHYKGKEDEAQSIGKDLRVGVVLTGRVIQRGDDLNIQLELIDINRQSQLWGEQYTRKIAELLTVQDEIERSVTLQLHITGEESRALPKHGTENTDAYQLYLRGRYYWDKRTVSDFSKALQYFQQSLDLDPGYALAQTGVADCFDLLGLGIYNGMPPSEALPKAKAAIAKAFQLDSSLGAAYTTRGHMNNSYEWDWPRAETDFRRAIELSPKYASGHVFYATFLAGQGRRDESRKEYIIAQELEPLSLPINTWLGIDYYWDREYEKSIEVIRKTIDIDASFSNARYFIAWPYLAMGNSREAVRQLEIGRPLSGDNPVILASLVYALSRDKQYGRARKLLDTLVALAKQRYVCPLNLALAYIGVGDTTQFYRALGQAVDEHSFIITVGVLRVDPVFDFARTDPRFRALWKKTGLP
jgi:eukaryotic-like serine/threonine-protein kinase